MEMTRDARGFPSGDGAGGRTPHDKQQLKMTSTPPRGGFRLLYPHEEERIVQQKATLVYCVEHTEYDVTVVTSTLWERVTQHVFRSRIVPRSQRIDPPQLWAKTCWQAWQAGGAEAVGHALKAIEEDAKDRRDEVMSHG